MSDPSRVILPNARKVWLNEGKAGLIGHRPAHSQTPKTRRNDAPTVTARRAEPSVTTASRTALSQCRLQRSEVPEVLGLHAVALDLAGQGKELEIVGSGVRSAAVGGEYPPLDPLL